MSNFTEYIVILYNVTLFLYMTTMNFSIYNIFQYLQSEGEDELKKRQLMELAIINGTYRDSQSKHSSRKLHSFIFTLFNLILTNCYFT